MKKKICLLSLSAAMGLSAAFAQAKIQVWDFGAEQFDTEIYQNMLSVDEINSWFPGTEPGTSGVSMTDWTASAECNIRFCGNGKTNHRLRTSNTALTRYDSNSKTDANGNVYTGYVYSNSSSTAAVYLASTYSPDDRIEFWVGSNGNPATYVFEAPSGQTQTGLYTKAAGVEKLTFYVSEAGEHKIYCTDEKLVVARILRYQAEAVTVSGTITAPATMPAGYELCFTNQANGGTNTVAPQGNAYSVSLAAGYEYEVSLLNANGYVVAESSCDLTNATGTYTHNLTISNVSLCTQSGAITGLSAAALAQVDFEFSVPEDRIFQPELTINRTDGTYTLSLEANVEYGITALNVNDFALGVTSVSVSANTVADLAFTAKPVYTITIQPTGATLADLAEATFTFANLNEEGYVYAFTGTDGIVLRDGVYSVVVENSGSFTQMLTSNLRVDGAPVTKVIDFTTDVTNWDFTDQNNYLNGELKNPCSGLQYVGQFKWHGAQYGGYGKNLTFRVPVSGPGTITIGVGYTWDVTFDGTQYLQTTNGGQTTIPLEYTGESGYAEIVVGSTTTSYISSIAYAASQPYAAVVYVGADKEYTTLNAALAAIRKMERPNDESVTVMIDPGNYEEMLVIDQNNIRFINAAATPSIALKNAGVDIDENAVRITSYYGHGYNYASMASNFKWDERTLQVNKENGYASVVNSGGSSDTYWNATVVVSGTDFYAENIIFENSYNQYISAKEADDVVYLIAGNTTGTRPTDYGNTSVQKRSYRERAAALATTKTSDRTFLNNCRVIGRQDSFYGAASRVACYKGALMGACDYLFGEMNLICYQTELVLNTSDDKNDVAYITAAKTDAGARGMLFFDCHVVSAVPGTESASTYQSQPGLWGRPWAANTAEAIFAACDVDKTNYNGEAGNYNGASLILPAGWSNGLSGESARCGEYACNVSTDGRVAWAPVFTSPETADGVQFTLYNWTKGTDGWDPFAEYGIDTNALPGTQYTTALPGLFTEAGLAIIAGARQIMLRGVQETTTVEVYTVEGRLVAACQIDADAEIAIPAQGVYVVRTVGLSGQTSAQKVCL